MVTGSTDHLRKDARRNRQAILEAARTLFAESDDVAMCQVARAAGVGQATLYRHFPDRGALAAEILGEFAERMSDLAAEHEGDPDAFFVLLRSLVDGMVHLHALSELARDDARGDARLGRNRERIADVMKGPLCDAKAAGRLRRDTSLEDVFLIVAMVRGAMQGLPNAAARSTAAHRVLAIALDGITPVVPLAV